jgi:hypothetical protein
MNNMEKYVANRIRTPDGTILESMHRHDYVTYIDANGKEYMVDGGLDYLRRNIHDDAPYTELSILSSDEHSVIREVFKWGTYGIDGKQKLKYVILKDMSWDHIEAILETQTQLREHIRQVFVNELDYRGKNDEAGIFF